MTQIVVFPRGQLTAADKRALREAGVVPVEADNPKDVVTVVPLASGSAIVNPDDMLMSALFAITKTGSGAGYFTEELYRRLRVRESEGDHHG